MELFTKIDAPTENFKIDYTQSLAFVGSCFAENISRKFSEFKFKTLLNPLGTLYNPLSIGTMIENICKGKVFTEKDVFLDSKNKRCWHCWEAHGVMSRNSKVECIEGLNRAIQGARDFLQKADVLFITFGSSFVYFLKENGLSVANCHRQEATLFERRLISVETAALALHGIVKNLQALNSRLKIVFTVSPLRHLSDGFHNNTLSKATLHLAIQKVLEEAADNRLSYFPSYEIVMDELRDYRFYDSDMIHLSKTAEDIIFERMQQTYMTSSTIENMRSIEKFLKSVNHKIIDKESPQTFEFAKATLRQASILETRISGLDLSQEKERLSSLQLLFL